MDQSIFTSLVQHSMAEARSRFANTEDDVFLELIKANPEAFTESFSFGHTTLLMSIFMDYTLQNYHNFLCIVLKEKGIDISNLEDFRHLLAE